MGRIFVVDNQYDNIIDNIIDNKTNEFKNKEDNVIFENVYEEILKMFANYELQNTNSKKIIDNSGKQLSKIVKREAIWFK